MREIISRWLTAIDPKLLSSAIEIGLMCKWPDYAELSIEVLERPVQLGCDWPFGLQESAARSLRHYTEELTDEQIARIGDILLGLKGNGCLLSLEQLLTRARNKARVEVLRKLAGDHRPWLWWHAVYRLNRWEAFEGRHDSLPDKLKLRVFLVCGPEGFSDCEQIWPRANEILISLLTPELKTFDLRLFIRVLNEIATRFDVDSRTAIFVNLLRGVEIFDSHNMIMACRIVKYINLWHGLNIGGLGTDINRETPKLYEYDWSAITAKVIEWYDSE